MNWLGKTFLPNLREEADPCVLVLMDPSTRKCSQIIQGLYIGAALRRIKDENINYFGKFPNDLNFLWRNENKLTDTVAP